MVIFWFLEIDIWVELVDWKRCSRRWRMLLVVEFDSMLFLELNLICFWSLLGCCLIEKVVWLRYLTEYALHCIWCIVLIMQCLVLFCTVLFMNINECFVWILFELGLGLFCFCLKLGFWLFCFLGYSLFVFTVCLVVVWKWEWIVDIVGFWFGLFWFEIVWFFCCCLAVCVVLSWWLCFVGCVIGRVL